MDLHKLTLTEAFEGLRDKKFTSEELTRSCFDNIKKNDESIGAFLTLNEKEGSKEKNIGQFSLLHEYGLPYVSYDIRQFHHIRGIKRDVSSPEGMNARRAFDLLAEALTACLEIDLIALGGYMSYTTIKRCVNVHPADLSIKDASGSRRFTGANAVFDAICAGEKELRASTLYTDEGVDSGPLLMVSEPLAVELPLPLESLLKDKEMLAGVAEEHQERLKEIGDWKIFPRTVELIARGRFSLDENNVAYLEETPLDAGYREGR